MPPAEPWSTGALTPAAPAVVSSNSIPTVQSLDTSAAAALAPTVARDVGAADNTDADFGA
jgi:hypothetical protein